MTQKGFSQIILLGIIAVFTVAGVGGFLVFTGGKIPFSEKIAQHIVENVISPTESLKVTSPPELKSKSAPSVSLSPSALGNLCSGEEGCVSFCLNNRMRCEKYCKGNDNELCKIIFPPGNTSNQKTSVSVSSQPVGYPYLNKSNNPDIIYGIMPPLECKPRNGHEYYRTDKTFVIDPTNPQIMYVNVEHKGFYKSIDGGETWAPKTKGIKTYPKKDDTTKPCHGEYPVAVIDPQNPQHIVFGISGPSSIFQKGFWGETGGLVESWDGAETWQPLLQDWMNRYVTDIAIDPTDSKTIYYSTTAEPGPGDPNKIFVTKGLVYKTKNGGKNWEELPTGFFAGSSGTAIHIDPKSPENILFFTLTNTRASGRRIVEDVKQFGISRSFNAGATWVSMHSLPEGYDAIVWSAASPHNASYLFVTPWGSPEGQPLRSYYSVNGGETFQPSGNYIHITEYDPHDTSSKHMLGYKRIDYLAPDESHTLFESNDAGATWHSFGSMPKEVIEQSLLKEVSTITWDPINKDTVYMTGAGGYIWKSTDGGKSWQAILSYDKLSE